MTDSVANYPQFKPALRNEAFALIDSLYPISANQLRTKLRATSRTFGRGELTLEVGEVVRELIDDPAISAFTVTGRQDTPKVVFMPKGVQILDAGDLLAEPPVIVRLLTLDLHVDLPDNLLSEALHAPTTVTFTHPAILTREVRKVAIARNAKTEHDHVLKMCVALSFDGRCDEREIQEAVAQMAYKVDHPFIVKAEIAELHAQTE